ncbi:MAG: SurA N-terminal domain-containing protein [Rikenellaceae bacterium]|nr:SurA N-terminal domain-containing protein [Rikenellaceae bacterium]
MISLNTLRTKFGVILSVVIGIALLAFILSLKTEMGFTGQDPKVGEIAGEKINYSEYYNEYEQIKAQSGIQETDEQQSAMLANAVWQSLVAKHLFEPAFEKMGLQFTDAERLALLSGEQFSQTLYNAFADPATGEYNVAAVSQFLAESESNPQAAAAWQQLIEQLGLESSMQKFYGLVKGGVYVNALEVAQGQKAQNETRSGKWVVKRYNSVPDSLFEVSSSEIKAYYNANKNAYKQLPNRQLQYVVFEVTPTEEDLAALEQEVTMVGEEFAAAEDVRAFTRENRNGSIAEAYVTADQLTSDEAEALMAGKMYGPVLRNNEWSMARVLDTKMVPDSLGIRHIVLPYTEVALADSLMTALKGGADFAEAAAQHSVFAQTAQLGGEVGVMPFAAFTGEFAEVLATAKTGDIVKIASGDAIQLMQVYRADKPSKHIRVASITYPVLASSATRRTAHSTAGTFTVNAKEGFEEAASAAAITPRTATLVQGDRTIRGLEDSREVARWAYGAKVGDVSEIFSVGDDYVIATVTAIDDAEYRAVESVASQIRMELMRDKKFEYLKTQMVAPTIEEVATAVEAEVADYTDAAFGAYYLSGPGLEPALIGAIASTTEKDVVSAPVKGLNGVYVFTVNEIVDSAAQTAEAEKVRAQATAESIITQSALQAVQEMGEIKDERGLYF